MKIPTLLEVETFVIENGLAVIAQDFYNYYKDLHWMVGKRPMSSWKYTLRNWHKKELNFIARNFGYDVAEAFTMPTEDAVLDVINELKVARFNEDLAVLPLDCEPEWICIDYRDNKEWRIFPYWSKYVAKKLEENNLKYDHSFFLNW